MRNDEAGADWQQHYRLWEEAEARQEFARAAELAARLGNHPLDEARGVERVLLVYAGLSLMPERNPAQHTLNI